MAKHLDDPEAARFRRQIRRPGGIAKVNMREPLRLGELGIKVFWQLMA